MKVTVIGSGYVGLVTAACLADLGNDVFCLDIDAAKVAALRQGVMPIHEPGLGDVVQRNALAGRLRFSTDTADAARHGRVQFIAVGTPQDEDGSADLQYVLAAARELGRHMDGYRVVVDKSTVPVGTAKRVGDAIGDELRRRGVEHRFSVVSNPEFLKEGAAIDDFMRPDRIVVGSDDDEATAVMRQLYAPFERNHSKVMVMDVASAELTKYAANAMLATRISFMNEMALVAEALGADIDAGAPRHRQRQAHRQPLPLCRLRLRRLLLSEGRAGADPHGRRRRPGDHLTRCRRPGERAAEARRDGEGGEAARLRPDGPRRRRLGPGLQARHRRPCARHRARS